MGMGGSSLAPEVMRRLFGAERFHVLDTPPDGDPAARGSDRRRPHALRRRFEVGTTLDGPRRLLPQAGWAVRGRHRPRLAAGRARRRRLLRRADDRGRYLALSVFGLLPAALMGSTSCASSTGRRRCARPAAARTAIRGRLGLLAEQQFLQVDADFGLWVEQLVAESTGKEGKGIVPVRDGGETPDITLPDSYELGQEFFRWEFATAVAARFSASTPSTSPTSRRRRTRRAGARAGEATADRDGSLDELLAEGGPGATWRSRPSSTPPARASSSRSFGRRAGPGPPSPSGWGRGISTRRDSSTRAGRTRAFRPGRGRPRR